MASKRIKKLFVGIDYGTTKSSIATIQSKGSPVLYKLDSGDGLGTSSIPSAVVLERRTHNQFFIHSTGLQARNIEKITRGYCRFERAKLDIGMNGFVTNKPENYQGFEKITPEDIAAILIRKLKQAIELRKDSDTGYTSNTKRFYSATISVPANWNPVQRQATKYAALMAGFDNVELVEEPIAALLYIWNNQGELLGLGNKNERLMIIDMGGGTCDIAVVDIIKPLLFPQRITKIVNVNGNNFLGGELIEKMLEEMIKRGRPDIGGDDLRARIEGLKIELNNLLLGPQMMKHLDKFISKEEAWPTNLNEYFPEAFTGKLYLSKTNYQVAANDLHRLITSQKRSELNTETDPERTIIKAFVDLITDVKRLCGSRRKIDRVILVGGSSQLYFVRPILHWFFRDALKWGDTLYMPANPQECVALGAAKYELERHERRKTFKPKFFYNVNIKISEENQLPIVKANRPLPIRYSRAKSDPFSVINPVDEIVIQMKGMGTETTQQQLNMTKVLSANKTVQPIYRLQARASVSVDGIISLIINESNYRVRFNPVELYPLQKKVIKDHRERMLARLPRFEMDDLIP